MMNSSLLAVAATAALNLVMSARAEIRSVEVGQPVPLADNAGDTWVAAWAKNGAVCTPQAIPTASKKLVRAIWPSTASMAGPQVCPKFNREGDKSLFVFTAGDWDDPDGYRLTVVPLVLGD